MRIVRRLTGLVSGAAGASGLVLCVAGLVGVWAGYREVVRRVDRVFAGADQALGDVEANLGQATTRLREAETELEAVRKREADLAAQPPADRGARRAASRKSAEALGSQVGEARAILVKATEAALVANGLLEALAELPAVERVNVDVDRVKETSTQLSDLTDRTTRLADMLARAAPPADDSVAGESSRTAEAIRRPIALAEAGSDRLADGRRSLADARARLMWWVDRIVAGLAAVLIWIGAGQLSLAVHGWKMVRH